MIWLTCEHRRTFVGYLKLLRQIFERWDDANKMQIRHLDNAELFLKLYSEQRNWKQSATKKQENFKNGKVRFCLNIDIRKDKEDSWLSAIKTKIAFAKARLNFQQQEHNNCNRHCSPCGIPF